MSSPSPSGSSQAIFVYGTLMAEEMLAWLLTGSSENSCEILALRQPAVLHNYRRVPVKHSDYLALIPGGPSDKVEGYLIFPRSESEWRKIDDFEGEIYKRHHVHVSLKPDMDVPNSDTSNKVNNDVKKNQVEREEDQKVPAQVYLWAGDMDNVWKDRAWDFLYFKEKRLPDWLDLFGGMEMVGIEMLAFGLELEGVACFLSHIKTDIQALEKIADGIRCCGGKASTFLPMSARERPDYSIWNVALDVTILEDTSTMSSDDSSSVRRRDTICLCLEAEA